MTCNLSVVPAALLRPDRAFAGQGVYRLPKLTLVIALFFLSVTGERLTQGYYQNSHAKELALLEIDTRMSGLMQNAPSDVQARMREQLLASVVGERSLLTTAIGIAFSGIAFLAVLLEMWLACMVVSQFFGGQEDRHGGDRPSLTLFLIAFIPLALRKLLSGAVLALRRPDAAANALTLAEYRRLSAIRFDFFSLLPLDGVPGFLSAAARFLSDPFFLWTLAILWFGGREVYHFPLKNAMLQTLVLVTLLSLQAALLARIGLAWEL